MESRSPVRPGAAPDRQSSRLKGRWPLLVLLFVGSGFPALVYQVVWQRSLFTLFGTDSVATAVIVSAFMLGLGSGSLLGGELSRRPSVPLLRVFAALELGTGLFALVSLPLFERVGGTAPGSPFGLFWMSFLLVLVPTAMMGMTLPLLTTFLVRHSGLVGRSVGTLYAANTLGSALACLLAAYGLMPYLGKQRALLVAASINAIVGLLVLLLDRRERSDGPAPQVVPVSSPPAGEGLPAPLGMVAAAACGFLSLGFEVAWYRLFSIASAGRAETFPVMLGYFLAGTAAGSLVAGWMATAGSVFHRRPREALAVVLALACISGLLVTPLLVLAAPHVAGTLRQAPLVVLPAALFGMVLPLACELSRSTGASVGRNLGRLYAANIAGATLGALAVGLVLMDLLSLRLVSIALLALGLLAGAILAGRRAASDIAWTAGLLCAGLAASGVALVGPFYERLQPQFSRTRQGDLFAEVIENRSGVITVDRSGVVYGGGVYDGRFGTDLLDDASGIVRPYALGAVHPAPERVLMIGLAGGAWAQVVANNPAVRQLVVVEINPGYVELVARHGTVASLLENPKVRIVFGDGRQWLKAHPSARFDAIIMNTTFSWRNNASNVLSQEFLELVADRLAQGGVALLNPTGSPEVVATALSVFPHALEVHGALFLGRAPLAFDRVRWLAQLEAYRIDGKPLAAPGDTGRLARLRDIAAGTAVKDRSDIAPATVGRRRITDDNMGVEWPRRSP